MDTGPQRDRLDEALRAARAVKDLRQHGDETTEAYEKRLDEAWDRVLEPLDAFLEEHQAAHLRAVDAAGRSGRP